MLMKNRCYIILFIQLIFFSFAASAQKQLVLNYQGNIPYITYKVKQGETLSAIARQFGTDIGTAMRFNGFNAQSMLEPGMVINVPVNTKMLKQTADNTAVIHTVQPGETLYRISVNHNKTPVELLKQWNNLSDNSISTGQQLIVGYLATNAEQYIAGAPSVQRPTKETSKRNSAIMREDEISFDAPEKTTTNKETVAPQPTTPTIVPPTESVAPTKNEKQTNDSKNNVEYVKDNTFELSNEVKEKEASINPATIGKTGFFTPLFGVDVEGRKAETVTGTAMTFKSSSGWSDKKYYILMNDIPPGQIVKVASGKNLIYARVLWNLGDLKENQDLDFRISNAAAAALGITDAKFQIEVTYFE